MADTDIPRTVGDVLRGHYGSMWCPACGVGSAKGDDGVWRWDVAQHQAEALAAAGLLTTAEHDREVAARALRDLVADRADIERALALVDGSSVSVVDLIVRHVESEADRIAAGEGS